MTTRIFLFSDIHANLPAMQAIEQAVKDESPDRVIFLGDMFDMGPHPAEVVDLIMAHADWELLRGNHEGYMNGENISRIIDGEERNHQAWTRKQLRPDQIEAIHSRCQWQIDETVEGVPMRFLHYARQAPPNEDRFASNLRPKPHEMEGIFNPEDRKFIAFGHLHYAHNGSYDGTTYLSVGPSGPWKVANQTQHVLLDVSAGDVEITPKTRQYDDRKFFADMEALNVPARQTIFKIFYGGRGLD